MQRVLARPSNQIERAGRVKGANVSMQMDPPAQLGQLHWESDLARPSFRSVCLWAEVPRRVIRHGGGRLAIDIIVGFLHALCFGANWRRRAGFYNGLLLGRRVFDAHFGFVLLVGLLYLTNLLEGSLVMPVITLAPSIT